MLYLCYLYTIRVKKSIRTAYSYTKILPTWVVYRILKVYMKIKQTVKSIVLGLIVAAGLLVVAAPTATFAATNNKCEVDTAIIKCDNVDVTKDGVRNTGVFSILLTAINILTAGVGVAALGGLVYGAIMYISSGGNAEQTKKAIGIITNVVIGIVAYAGMFALLNFLVPGGVFNVTPTP